MNEPTQPIVTAVLDDAVMLDLAKGPVICGNVSYDIHGRWEDGRRIATSYIDAQLGGDTFRTLAGDVYRVVTWRGQSPALAS